MSNHKNTDSQPVADTGNLDTLIETLQAPVLPATAGVELDKDDGDKLTIDLTNPETLDSLYDLLRERLGETDGQVFDVFVKMLEDHHLNRLAEAERRVSQAWGSKGGTIAAMRRSNQRPTADKLPVSDRAKPKPPTMADIMGGLRQRSRARVLDN